MAAERISVGIVNHNGESYLAPTRRTVERLGPEVDDMLRVDSGSTDSGPARAREHFPCVRVIELGANLGPGPARNQAIREARHDRVRRIDNGVEPKLGSGAASSAALDPLRRRAGDRGGALPARVRYRPVGRRRSPISLRQTCRFTPVRIRYTVLRFAPALAAFEVLHLLGAIGKGSLGPWLGAAGSATGLLSHVLRVCRELRSSRPRGDVEVPTGGPFPSNQVMHGARLERSARRMVDLISGPNWRLAGGRHA